MNGYSTAEIWAIIVLLALGTYLLRFSFLGLLGDRPMPAIVRQMLRYTPVAVLPGMVAPLVLWPAATDGQLDVPRLSAAFATLLVGAITRSAMKAISAGVVVLVVGIFLFG